MMFKIIYGFKPDDIPVDFDDRDVSSFLNERFKKTHVTAGDFEDLIQHIKDNNLTVHTYNPLIPNFLDEDEAREVCYIYSLKYHTLIKAFDNFILDKKLTVLCPGEALADSYLENF